MQLEAWQIAVGAAASLLIGFSKTGVPGSGILVVPMMAAVFGGHLSIGATLPLLIAADCFAVAFYRSHADWSKIKVLLPWVGLGLLGGMAFLKFMPPPSGGKDLLARIIGGIVLAMLAIQVSRSYLGDRLVPHSKGGTVVTGALAGFTTMTSNAAGPIMAIYMTSTGLPKQALMGTSAWYFFILNLVKVPLLVLLTVDDPANPLITFETLGLNVLLLPLIVVGAFLGRKLLPVIPEKAFSNLILILAFVAAVKLIL